MALEIVVRFVIPEELDDARALDFVHDMVDACLAGWSILKLKNPVQCYMSYGRKCKHTSPSLILAEKWRDPTSNGKLK